MADQQGPAAPFPTPPPFYKHFTKQNISRLRQIRRDAGITQPISNASNDLEDAPSDIDITSLPPELRYLIPPSPPTCDTFQVFGQQQSLHPREPTLAEANIPQLYPDHPSIRLNPAPTLLALSRSMLTSFLSLTGILSQNPELYEEKVEDLRYIVFNMHDLINGYRPHQARQELIGLMEERVRTCREEVKRIEEGDEKVRRVLGDLRGNGMVFGEVEEEFKGAGGGGGNVAEQEIHRGDARRKDRQRAAWRALGAEMG